MKCQPGEVQAVIPITSDMQMIPQKAKSRKQRGTKEPLDESESEKTGLKLNNQKTKIMASRPITSWQIGGKTMETVTFS